MINKEGEEGHWVAEVVMVSASSSIIIHLEPCLQEKTMKTHTERVRFVPVHETNVSTTVA
jgi:hypothetical protein